MYHTGGDFFTGHTLRRMMSLLFAFYNTNNAYNNQCEAEQLPAGTIVDSAIYNHKYTKQYCENEI